MLKNILAPTDFSAHAEHAVGYAFELAAKCDAKVHLLHAYSPPLFPEGAIMAVEFLESLQKAAQEFLDKAAKPYENNPYMGRKILKLEDAREAIVRSAKDLEADLIVMGTQGRRGFRRALLGSVAEAVVRTSPCPVMTMHLPSTENAEKA